MKRKFSLVAMMLLLALAAFVAVTKASPPSGVTPTVLARGTFDAFKVKSAPGSPVDFKAKAKSPVDFVVRRHDYAVGSTTGWHSHPGPVFITVTQGQLTYYEYDDPSCAPHVVSAGQGFVDSGRGHIVRNESGLPAQDVSVIIAPVGGAFRGELAAPGPYCGF
jgi:quercetin dioxygenase-like cupin family protein